jgi:hypothetical protein
VVEPEEEAVDLQETDVDQAILDNEKALLAEVQQALARIHPLSLQEAWAHLPSFGRQSSSGSLPPDTGQLVRVQNIAYCFDFPVQNVERYH